jgi:hypothetical protein
MRASTAAESPHDRAVERLRTIALARVGIGALTLFRTTPLCGLLDPSLNGDARPLLGWPVEGATAAFGLGLAPGTLKVMCIARTLGLIAFTLGAWPRVGALVAVVSGYLVLFQAPFAFTSTQHVLLQATLLLGLADSSAVLALRPQPPRSPASSVWMLRAFVASVYAWASYAKLRHDWLDGRTLALFHDEGRLRGPLADLLLSTPGRCAVVGRAVALTELSLGPLLLLSPTRSLGLALAVAFHLGIEWMGHPDVIGWAMLCLLVVFVDSPSHRTQ